VDWVSWPCRDAAWTQSQLSEAHEHVINQSLFLPPKMNTIRIG
jgi:hypothetical protein